MGSLMSLLPERSNSMAVILAHKCSNRKRSEPSPASQTRAGRGHPLDEVACRTLDPNPKLGHLPSQISRDVPISKSTQPQIRVHPPHRYGEMVNPLISHADPLHILLFPASPLFLCVGVIIQYGSAPPSPSIPLPSHVRSGVIIPYAPRTPTPSSVCGVSSRISHTQMSPSSSPVRSK